LSTPMASVKMAKGPHQLGRSFHGIRLLLVYCLYKLMKLTRTRLIMDVGAHQVDDEREDRILVADSVKTVIGTL
jgi:hypothetical protein